MRPRVKTWQGRAVVEAVHDGDTFKCTADLGFRISINFNVRLEGAAAPELDQPGGIGARDALAAVLPAGCVVTLESKRLDKYGRAEARVLTEDGADIGAAMIGAGFCVAANDSGALK
jgi:endonuclease YncB( thermonuclease family)